MGWAEDRGRTTPDDHTPFDPTLDREVGREAGSIGLADFDRIDKPPETRPQGLSLGRRQVRGGELLHEALKRLHDPGGI